MTSVQKPNIDEEGILQEYMPAQPMKMICEVIGCNETNGKDYTRKNHGSHAEHWSGEPIFLCLKHSYLGME